MKKTLFLLCAVILGASCNSAPATQPLPAQVTISKERLLDKIKGGWAGQTIGCTYGGPTEFKFNGTMIQEYTPIPWPEHYIKWWYENTPGLYDDVYMDLTFVEVFDRLGIDAPVDSLAAAFANAGYVLWHANQAARYNILNGIRPPESGHWLNNPHGRRPRLPDRSRFRGAHVPGHAQRGLGVLRPRGHIMNYGDGWYGGVYVAAMYSLSFVSDDIGFIVEEALKTIPEQSRYHRCMKDVIAWHKQYPGDWKRTWFECEKKWSSDIGCPDGVFVPFNIDAVTNSAYILIGLLYGEGDFSKTLDIATRCGQDSDCNPASAGGILGAMLGYSKIPEKWMRNLREVEDMEFAYTDISLNRTYKMSFDQALEVIRRNGGSAGETDVTIACQQPVPVRFEQSFEGHYPTERRAIHQSLPEAGVIEFDGIGAVLTGALRCPDESYVAEVTFSIDGQPSNASSSRRFTAPAAMNCSGVTGSRPAPTASRPNGITRARMHRCKSATCWYTAALRKLPGINPNPVNSTHYVYRSKLSPGNRFLLHHHAVLGLLGQHPETGGPHVAL